MQEDSAPYQKAAAELEQAIKVAFHPDDYENLLPEDCYRPIVSAIRALIDARLDERALIARPMEKNRER